MSSGFSSHLGPPPAGPHQQKAPIVKKFRLFTLEGVTDELQNPADHEQGQGIGPEKMKEDARDEYCQRNNDQRNAKCMTNPVHRMLMAAGILRDPLFVTASA